MPKKPAAKAKAAVAKYDRDVKAKNKRVAETNEVNRDLSNSRLYSGQGESIYPDLEGRDRSAAFQANSRKPSVTDKRNPGPTSPTEIGEGPDPLLNNEHLSIKKRGSSMGTE